MKVVLLQSSIHLALRHELESIDGFCIDVDNYPISFRTEKLYRFLQLFRSRVVQIVVELLWHNMRFCFECLQKLFLKSFILHLQDCFFELVGVSVVLQGKIEPPHISTHPQLVYLEGPHEAHHLDGISCSKEEQSSASYRPVLPLVYVAVEGQGNRGSVSQ